MYLCTYLCMYAMYVCMYVCQPSFPSCLPAVTSVGATKLESDGTEDTGVSFSGGGFTPSQYFTRSNATWQEAAVQAYSRPI